MVKKAKTVLEFLKIKNTGMLIQDIGAILFIGGLFVGLNPVIMPIGAILWGVGKLMNIFEI